MYNPMTWKDDQDNVQTRAGKPALARRLYLMERFYALYNSCQWALRQYRDDALLARSNSLPTEVSVFISKQLPGYRKRYLQCRQRLANLCRRIEAGNMSLPRPEELSPQQNRTVTQEQLARLMTVLKDNGIDEDEADTVAEAACFVLDMEADIPSNTALCRIAHAFPALHSDTILAFCFEPIEADDVGATLLVHVEAELDPAVYSTIEDAIASYIESVPAWSFERLVCDVLYQLGYSFEILKPTHTFRI